MPREKPECKGCGACCISPYDQESYCDITDEDIARIGSRRHIIQPTLFDQIVFGLPGAAIATRWRKMARGPLKGNKVCVCAFLRRSVLHDAYCSVYDRRPDTCRKAVKPGDKTCRYCRDSLKEGR